MVVCVKAAPWAWAVPLWVLVVGMGLPAYADKIYLSEERLLEGVIIRDDADTVSFEMDGAGVWTLSRDSLARIEREDPGEYWLRIAERHARASRLDRARKAFLRAADVSSTNERASRRLKDLDLLVEGSSASLAYTLKSIDSEKVTLADPPEPTRVPQAPPVEAPAVVEAVPPPAKPVPSPPAPVQVVQAPAPPKPAPKIPPRIPTTRAFKPSNDVAQLVRKYARQYGVDPLLIQAIIKVESNGNPKATSSSGAQGLMQLMPETASSLGVRNAYDPEQNIKAGVKYIRMMLDEYSHMEWEERRTHAVAAYHAGPNKLKDVGDYRRIPATLRYTQKVAAAYDALYRDKRQEVALLDRLPQSEVD